MSPLGKTIVSRLRRLDKTQAWLAEQVGVSENAVSKWILTGKISRENSIKAANALQMGVTQLLNEDPTPDLDERFSTLPKAIKQRLLALVEEIARPPPEESREALSAKQKHRAQG